MPVICAKCGEELLGAVNRCWRCGQYALSTPDAAAAPPVRRSPVWLEQRRPPAAKDTPPESDLEPAILYDVGQPTGSPVSDDGVEFLENSQRTDDSASEPSSRSSDSTGNRDREISPAAPATSTPRPTVSRSKPTNWQDWIAIGGVVAGLLSIGIGWWTPWMLLLAVAGIVCGVLGIASRRKTLAIVALLLCMLGVSVSSVRLAYDVFFYLGDRIITPVDPLPEDDMFDPLDMEPLE